MRRLIGLIAAFLVLTAFLFTLSGCDKFSEKAYSVAYDILAEPKNLDPQTASDQASLIIINNVFEGLFYIDEFGAAKNGLAKNVKKSPNGLELTIELIDNAAWENGEKITAHDFVFAFQRILMPDTNSPAASQFYCLKNARLVHSGEMPPDSLGVRATAEKTLVFDLDYPNDNLEYLLATTYAMPCNKAFFEETKGKYGLKEDKIMSNGAFDLYSWKHNEAVTLKKSESYHDRENVKPTFVTLFIKVEGTPIDRLLDEKIDAALISGSEVEKMTQKGLNTEAIESETWGIYLNTKKKYLSNKNIRNAISYCFDRDSYAEHLDKNLTVATGIIPHSIMLFDKSFREYSGETISKAFSPELGIEHYMQGLQELSATDIPALKLLINKDSGMKNADYFAYPSQVLQRELSLFVNIDEVDATEYGIRLGSGDFDLAVVKLTSGDNTANSILSRFMSNSPQNSVGYNNPEYDKLLDTASASTDKSQTISNYAQAEKMLIDDAVFIPMYYLTDYFATEPTTTGIIRNKRTGLISFKEAATK